MRSKGGYTMTRNERSVSGKIIETARMEKDLSIWQVSCLTKLSDSTIRNMEFNGVMFTRVNTLLAVCEVLDLDPMKLIEADTGKRYDGLQR